MSEYQLQNEPHVVSVDEHQVIDWMTSPPSSKLFRKIHSSHAAPKRQKTRTSTNTASSSCLELPTTGLEASADPFQVLSTASEGNGLLDQWLTKLPETTLLHEILSESKALLKEEEEDILLKTLAGSEVEKSSLLELLEAKPIPGDEFSSGDFWTDMVDSCSESGSSSFPSEGIGDQDLLDSLANTPLKDNTHEPRDEGGHSIPAEDDFYGDSDPLDLESLALIDAHIQQSQSMEQSRAFAQYVDSLKSSIDHTLGYLRFQVVSVLSAVIGSRIELVCTCLSAASPGPDHGFEWYITLEDEWANSPLCLHDLFHVTGPWDTCLSTTTLHAHAALTLSATAAPSLFFILFPDYLVSSTTLSDATSCLRRAYLHLRYSATQLDAEQNASPAVVEGSMTHELFQYCLAHKDFRFSFVRQRAIPQILRRHLTSLAGCPSLDETTMESKLVENASKLIEWARRYMPRGVQLDEIAQGSMTANVVVLDVLDIEDYIAAPQYGLKGKIDATFLVQKTRPPRDQQSGAMRMPFEFKTGRVGGSASHRAQASLYTLLLESKYGAEARASESLLCYLNGNVASDMMTLVPAVSHELRALLATRNALVRCLVDASRHAAPFSPPPQLNLSSWTCKTCFDRDKCLVLATLEPVDLARKSLAYETLPSVTSEEREWFQSHDSGLSHEERLQLDIKAHAWNSTLSWTGKVVPGSMPGPDGETDSLSYSLSFRQEALMTPFVFKITLVPAALHDASSHRLRQGDSVSVSYIGPLRPQYFVASGFIQSIAESQITLKVDRDFRIEKQKTNLFLLTDSHGLDAVYKLDRDASVSVFAYLRSSLLSVFREARHAGHANRIRALVSAALKTGSLFDALASQASLHIATPEAWHQLAQEGSQLSQDIILVGAYGARNGMLLSLIQVLACREGKTILLLAPPALWIEGDLARLFATHGIAFWQVGARGKSSSSGPIVSKAHDADAQIDGCAYASAAQLRALWQSRPVLALAHSSTIYYTHPIFSVRTWFDCCIWIDFDSSGGAESCSGPMLSVSQLSLLAPLRMSQQWIFFQ